jgi:Co/Zn/Cd efflux system component
LGLNAALAASLFVGGVVADSSGLIASALDNASDAGVYAIALSAVPRGTRWKVRAARASGLMLLVLSAGVIADVVRRFVVGAEPVGLVMMVMTVIAIAINVLSLRVLRGLDRDEVHVRATWTFSMNDFLSNVGVLLAAVLIGVLDQAWPDLVAGLAIAALSAKGGIEILVDARREEAKLHHASTGDSQ